MALRRSETSDILCRGTVCLILTVSISATEVVPYIYTLLTTYILFPTAALSATTYFSRSACPPPPAPSPRYIAVILYARSVRADFWPLLPLLVDLLLPSLDNGPLRCDAT